MEEKPAEKGPRKSNEKEKALWERETCNWQAMVRAWLEYVQERVVNVNHEISSYRE